MFWRIYWYTAPLVAPTASCWKISGYVSFSVYVQLGKTSYSEQKPEMQVQ